MASVNNAVMIALVVVGLALIGMVLFWASPNPVSPPAPLTQNEEITVSTFAFKKPVLSYKILPLNLTSGAGSTSIGVETPTILFLYNQATRDAEKQIFQTFAETNASYFLSFEMDRSTESSPLISAFGLGSQSLPAVVVFSLGVVVGKTSNITEPSLQSFVKKRAYTYPVKALAVSDFSSTGDLLKAPDKGLVIVNSEAACPRCDAFSSVFQSFANTTPSCLVYHVDAETPTGVAYLQAMGFPSAKGFPFFFRYSAGKVMPGSSLPVATVSSILSWVGIASQVVFKEPANNVVTAARWNTAAARLSSFDSKKPTLIFVHDANTSDKAKLAFQTFAEGHALLANYETLNASDPSQYAFFAASGYPDPAPYPVIIKYDIGGLPSKQSSRIFTAEGVEEMRALTEFDFTGPKSVGGLSFLNPGTDTASPAYVDVLPACVFVYSDSCRCDAKKRVYQQVFDTGSANLFVANSSDPATASFFKDSKIDPSTVAVHKWLQGTGSYSPDPIISAFDFATVSAYVK